MDFIFEIFGIGGDLNAGQMSSRAIIVFFYTLILIRIAGRRSFGLRAPFDNIIIILLGAILSRAVVGASPFLPTLAAGFVVSLLHRLLGLAGLASPLLDGIIKGKRISLYKNGKIRKGSLKRSLVTEEDLMEGVRLQTSAESLDKLEAIYMERNGQISTIKKEEPNG